MARRTKHPKLPNGFGSIKYLGKGRRNPYAVHPPTKEFTDNGSPITPKALCYVDDWYKGFYVLLSLKNGSFTEKVIEDVSTRDLSGNMSKFDAVSKIISAYNNLSLSSKQQNTFAQVYDKFYNYKYNSNNGRELSASSKSSMTAAFKNCAVLHDKPFTTLKTDILQKVVDDCPLKHASKELIVNLYRQMYSYALMNDLCTKDYSQFVKINTPDDDIKGIPFSEMEIDKIWKNKDRDPILQCILIMIYSGYRIGAYSKKNFVINMEEEYFQGGVKTASGFNRIVPIHPLIKGLVKPDLLLFTISSSAFRLSFSDSLAGIGIVGHTPHDCRHTFSWLCDKYKIDSLSKKKLLGHSLGNNITDSRYGHRTSDELRTEIMKIKHW